LGKISYSLYLLHGIVGGIIVAVGMRWIDRPANRMALLPVMLGLALLALAEKRHVLDFLKASLEEEKAESAFPNLKALLMEIPDVGTDEDFARLTERPSETAFP